ncbi:hypothetical protein DMENIID0001_019080 [Sergentomyia squamirostris]
MIKDLYEPGFSFPNIQLCSDKGFNLRLLILVMSAPDHFTQRESIRNSWGNFTADQRDIALGFLIGATNNETLKHKLLKENRSHGDLIRSKSFDIYRNLTLKSLAMLEWTMTYCPMVSFLLKTDDDTFINMKVLLEFMKNHSENRTIYGYVRTDDSIKRNKSSKYYVSEGEYDKNDLPAYVTGHIYLLTTDIISDLYTKALEMKFLCLEDVFITGLVAETLGIPRKPMKRIDFNTAKLSSNSCLITTSTAIVDINPEEQSKYWSYLQDKDLIEKCTV